MYYFYKISRVAGLALLLTLFSQMAWSQPIIGKPDGNLINFNNTNGNGGQLAHIQNGNLGSFTNVDRWIGIGNPTFSGNPLPVYGLRIQDSGQAATMSLNDNGGNGNLDFELQWGPDLDTKFRLNFINSPTNTNSTTQVMTALPNGKAGFGTDNPSVARVEINQEVNDGTQYGLYTQNRLANRRGSLIQGDIIGAFNRAVVGSVGSATANATRWGSYNQSVVKEGKFNIGGEGIGDGGFQNIGLSGRAPLEVSEELGIDPELNYGVYGEAPVQKFSFAGFFEGDVHVTGAFSSGSDRKLKRDIANESDALDKIMALKPSTYLFKDNGPTARMNLADGLQHGFIAQELEEVMPELVGEATQLLHSTEPFDPDNPTAPTEKFTYKTVNYMGLIPVLTAGIQEQQEVIDDQANELATQKAVNAEQQAQIDALRAELAALRSEISGTAAGSKAEVGRDLLQASVLYQNTPNPFSQSTEIRYEIAETARTAELLVFDMNGRQLRTFNNLRPGANTVTIEGSDLDAGMYFYSLVVDGAEVATKRMILTK